MNRIALLRKEKGMSQIALSMELNLSQKMISAYENGKSEPSIETLIRLADIFKTSVDYIIGYSDIKQPLNKIALQTLSKEEYSLLESFNSLPTKQQHIALGVILGLKSYIE